MGPASRQEGRGDGQVAFSLRMLLGICIYLFYLHSISQKLATWPHLAAREAGKLISILGRHVPS